MKLECKKYKKIRSLMKPGDILAFGRNDPVSNIIKWATKGPVAHVAIVIQTKAIDSEKNDNRFFNQIIEAVSDGVSIKRVSDYINTFEGDIWWLPLGDEVRNNIETSKLFNFLIKQKGKEYDLSQAVTSALDTLDSLPIVSNLTYNKEDLTKLFCSELIAAGLRAGGAIKNINPSEVTPMDICQFNIYKDSYYQILGKKKAIPQFNTKSPEGWGL